MGGWFSKQSPATPRPPSPSRNSWSPEPPQPQTPPCPLTSTPWRNISRWNEDLERSLRDQIKKIVPALKPNVILVGPVGAGKSSFINAILSVGKGFKIDRALTARGGKSCTTSYDKYLVNSVLQNIRLRDCMGIEQQEEEGFNVADMVSLLKGHVKDGYQFNPRNPITSSNTDYWRVDPKFEHQTHCVVFVVDSQVMNFIDNDNDNDKDTLVKFTQKIGQLQEAVKRLRIPRVLILTKADVLCAEVQKDTENMFRCVKVREAVKKASELFRIPEASIHPVTNYEDEDAIEITWKRNIPLLIALRQITQYANDRIEAVTEHSDSD